MAHDPHVIDPAGRGLHAEADLLRTRGTAAFVELPGGIRAWAPTRYTILKQLLADDRVSKDPNQHWPAWINGEFRETWVNSWVGVTNMFTAYGSNHRRLRKLISPAFTKRRTDGLRPRIEAGSLAFGGSAVIFSARKADHADRHPGGQANTALDQLRLALGGQFQKAIEGGWSEGHVGLGGVLRRPQPAK